MKAQVVEAVAPLTSVKVVEQEHDHTDLYPRGPCRDREGRRSRKIVVRRGVMFRNLHIVELDPVGPLADLQRVGIQIGVLPSGAHLEL